MSKIVATMRSYAAFFALLAWPPVAAQTEVSKTAKAINTVEDIEIGMSADPVIAALTKQGYALGDPFKDDPNTSKGDFAVWNVYLRDKYLGQFTVEHGRVTSVEVPVYTGQEGSSIELGEALYWILYDNGQALPSTERDWKQTATDVHFTTREIEQRTPSSSWRMIFADMANGASYRISLIRSQDGKPSVSVTKLAPFVRKK